MVIEDPTHDPESGCAPRFLSFFSADRRRRRCASAQTLALVGGSVYASPDAAPLADAVVLTSNGVITAIGSRSEVSIPGDARVIDCAGKTIVAGFWNSHVHFTRGRVAQRATAGRRRRLPNTCRRC